MSRKSRIRQAGRSNSYTRDRRESARAIETRIKAGTYGLQLQKQEKSRKAAARRKEPAETEAVQPLKTHSCP